MLDRRGKIDFFPGPMPHFRVFNVCEDSALYIDVLIALWGIVK